MTEPFFSPAEMAALQEAALPGMQTDIKIYHRTPTAAASIPSGSDYGDDVATYPVVKTTGDADLIVKGWLWQETKPVAEEDTGEIVTVNTIRLYVPLGTPVYPKDEVEAADEFGAPQRYEVSDTNADITWKAWLTVALRRLE